MSEPAIVSVCDCTCHHHVGAPGFCTRWCCNQQGVFLERRRPYLRLVRTPGDHQPTLAEVYDGFEFDEVFGY